MKSTNLANTTTLIMRVVFFILMLVLAWLHVDRLFPGLTTPTGMEQAQIAREVARGNGLVTKVIRPAAVRQNDGATDGDGTLVDAARNTYHAPLKPLLLGAVFKAVGAQNFSDFRPGTNEYVYRLDRVAAGFEIVCFLLAIGVSYVLVSRIFDPRIATTTAILMLLCNLMWDFSTSGLPQMLMLLLFSSGCYFAFRAFEASESQKLALIHSIVAAVFFALLCLTNWVAIWIVIGYAVAAAIFIRPRGIAGIIAFVVLLLASIVPVLQNLETSGVPGGTAFLAIFSGLGGSEEVAMRNLEVGELPLRTLTLSLIQLSTGQTAQLFAFLGGIIAAPIFFLSLLHPFKSKPISNFRWAILLMWVVATFGMGLFGLKEDALSASQLHILFAPLMAAYGLAMITVLWTKLSIVETMPALRNVPFVAIILISGSPLLLSVPLDSIRAFSRDQVETPAYPPYAPSILDDSLVDLVEPTEIVASDQPWAVAWYADRRSLWLPMELSDLALLEKRAEDEGTPIVAVLITPISGGMKPFMETNGLYRQYLSLILDGWASVATENLQDKLVSNRDRDMTNFRGRYPNCIPLSFRYSPMLLYTNRTPSS